MYGVFYKVTRNGKLFAGLNDELIEKFTNHDDAMGCCESLNMGGYLDELHSGYVVRFIPDLVISK